MYWAAYAKVDLSKLRYNIREYQKFLGDTTKIIAVVKADGYGHGAVEIARTAIDEGVDILAVARVKEGIELREAGIDCTILVLGIILPRETDSIIKNKLVPCIYSIDQLRELNQSSKKLNITAKFHLNIETGMNRLGIHGGYELDEFLDALDELEHVRFSGVMSHFAKADDQNNDYTKMQYRRFTEAMRQLRIRDYSPKTHISNSSATASYENYRLDYVRIGIGLYGLNPDEKNNIDIKPILSWYARVGQVKELKEGECVSYGSTYTAEDYMKTAIITIGYADGYPRMLGNIAQVLIGGVRCSVIGRVCMDLVVVDVSNVKEVNPGDEVVLIGTQGEETIHAKELADLVNTIHYEIVTGIQKRVERFYVDQD